MDLIYFYHKDLNQYLAAQEIETSSKHTASDWYKKI